MFKAICSNKPRPSVQSNIGYKNIKTGQCAWGRDVFHLTDDIAPGYHPDRRTLCGVDASDWIVIGEVEELDWHCCERCKKKVS
jgi:hypothetical protein